VRQIHLGENSRVLPTLPAAFARLCYIDPPFNTGQAQRRTRLSVAATDGPDGRRGFAGRRYAVRTRRGPAFDDRFDDYCAFLLPRIELALRCLTSDASLFVHLDAREVHYVKVALDRLLGRECFRNEIVWAYDYGARTRTRWPAKHDTILWYALDPARHVFRYEAIDRIPYLAPALVTPEKRARGKTPTDVWWQTIVPTSGREKTGYPTQKPLAILERIVRVHSEPGDVVLDFFAGSGTTGAAAARHGRGFVLVDRSRAAVYLAAKRLAAFEPQVLGIAPAPRAAAGPTAGARPRASPDPGPGPAAGAAEHPGPPGAEPRSDRHPCAG
jgi:site-specific DNA-methyltransferase (adenine-specific)